MNTYTISPDCTLILRDAPPLITDDRPELDVSKKYLRDLFVTIVYKLTKAYEQPEIAPDEAKRLHALIDEMVSIKAVILGKDAPGGIYPRRYQ